MLSFLQGEVKAQTVVFEDDFSTNKSATYTTTGAIGTSAWSVNRSGTDWGARRNTSPEQLELINDVSGTANANGWVYSYINTSSFANPYSSTLNQNSGLVTWTFNMRTNRANLAGFASGSYGMAFVLASSSQNVFNTGTGYAVVVGQSSQPDPIRLAKFSGGLSTGLTNIIVANTTGLTDLALQYVSVKVTYDPATDLWGMSLRYDGSTEFADPAGGTLMSQGTATDATYTGSSLNYAGAYWGGSTAANLTAFFDNFRVTVAGGATPSVAISSATASDANVNQGTQNLELQRFNLDVSSANATLNALTVTTSGTYAATDITALKAYYSTDATLDGSDVLLSTKTTSLDAGDHIMPSFSSQTINSGSTGYLFVTADVSPTATAGNTIRVATTPFSNIGFSGTVTKTGTDPVAQGGLKTFVAVTPSITLSSANPAVAAANIAERSTNNVIYAFNLAVTTANASFDGLTLTTAGTYIDADISNLKVWYSDDASFSSTDDVLLATKTSSLGAGAQVFTPFQSQIITNGTTGYIFITTDLPCDATFNNTLAVNAITAADLTFASGNITGSASAGGTQTIVYATPNNVFSSSAASLNGGATVTFGTPTSGSCYDELLIVAAAATNTGTPSGDGTAYTADLTYGNGTALDNGFVVYKGAAGTNISVAGLTNGTQYFFKIFTRNGTNWSSGVEVTATPAQLVQPGEILITQLSPDYGGASDEFVEIVNTTNRNLDLSTLALRYSSSGGSTPSTLATLSGTLAPYSYWLLASNNPTVTVGKSDIARDGSFTAGLAGTAGQIAIVRVADAQVIDGVGYGTVTAGLYYETAPASATTSDGALKRKFEIQDSNDNSADFEQVTKANIFVRNSTSRIVTTGTNLAAGNYNHLSVVGNASVAGDVTVNTLSTASGSLDIGADALTLNSFVLDYAGNGNLQANNASITINDDAGSLYFATGASLKLLTLTNDATATIASPLNIAAGANAGTVTVNAGATLTAGGNLTLKSDANGTARIAESAGTITGNVTVERYIAASGNRAWRLLAAPLQAATAPTIFNSWQESGDPGSYGTHITKAGSATDGFDAVSGSTSIRYYDGAALQYPTNTDVTKVTDNGAAWFLFVRGDRNINLSSSTASSNTTLRMKGALNMGPVSAGVLGTSGFSLIPNPYASNIDFEAVRSGNGSSLNSFYSWDASLSTVGAYRTVERDDISGAYEQTPSAGVIDDAKARYIRSGQAFYIPVNATLNFTESMKTAEVPANVAMRTPVVGEQVMINLYGPDGADEVLMDGVRVKYDDSYQASVNEQDIAKFTNIAENLGIARDGQLLAVERRPFIVTNDTIFLKLSGVGIRNYKLVVEPQQLGTSGLEAYLLDAFLNTSTSLSLTASTEVPFTVSNDAGSYNPNRFMIVFKPSSTLPLTAINLSAVRKEERVELNFTTINEHNMKRYEVERSANGINFTTIATIASVGDGNNSYKSEDAAPLSGINYYRIKAIDNNGKLQYAAIAKVDFSSTKPYFAVNPNPVTAGRINVTLSAPAGSYKVQLFNQAGQAVYSSTISHAGGITVNTLSNRSLAAGSYILKINGGEIKLSQVVLVQ